MSSPSARPDRVGRGSDEKAEGLSFRPLDAISMVLALSGVVVLIWAENRLCALLDSRSRRRATAEFTPAGPLPPA